MGILLAALCALTLECERFNDLGGWQLDSQFRSEMGSTYLLAHGLGVPVANAKTTVDIPQTGTYSVYARTMNWTAKWSSVGAAGRFQVIVDGRPLPSTLGTGSATWRWDLAGQLELSAGSHTIELHDLTGFDGRCDAICLTRDSQPPANRTIPQSLNSTIEQSNNRTIEQSNIRTFTSDLTVVGGGIAGICTAISAARLGLKVALVQDRPVLGGANSSEVRVHLGGYQNLGPYPRLGDVVSEIGPAKGGNAQPAARYEDDRKLAAVKAEPNVTLFLNTRVEKVARRSRRDRPTGTGSSGDSSQTDGLRIVSVTGFDVVSGKAVEFRSPLFADCTGDGTVGALAGADWRLGRESKAETGEEMAPEKGDKMTLGASVQWYAKKGDESRFPEEPWMIKFNEQNCEYNMRGDWDWETGMLRDQLNDFETVRDYGLLVVYSNWSYIKNKGLRKAEFANAALDWVAYVAGKRETRRLLGDHILTQQDVFDEVPYPDGTCCTTWAIDLHFPMPANQRNYPGEPFRSICTHDRHYAYPIPYRCFYSRNVPNLFMAGRDISVTHVALGTTRVMRTHGMMGEVVGMAASICKKHGCDPRGVYTDHLDELKALMTKGVGLGKAQPPQDYNCGACKFKGGKK